MSRFKDFDAALEELEPIEFTVKGRKYSISADPPCDTILKLMAEGRINDPAATTEVMEAMVGKDNLKQMREDGMGLTQLAMLATWLNEQVGFAATPDAGDEGNGSRSLISSSIGER